MGLVDFQAGLQGELLRRAIAQAQAEKQAHAMQMDRARLGLDTRKLDQDASQFDATLGLNRDKLGEDTRQFDTRLGEDARQFDAGAPQREAQTGFIRTQIGELERKPAAEAADRAHDIDMLTQREGSEGRLITQRGTEERKTKSAPDARTIAAGAGGPQGAYAQERDARTLNSVRSLSKKVNNWTTGIGSGLAMIPATDARDFAAELNTLKANIAFGELAAMRNASKTGGALGAVSDRELALLESALGALDPGQSPGALKGQLKQIEDSLSRWNNATGTTDPSRPPITAQEYDFVNGKLVPRTK